MKYLYWLIMLTWYFTMSFLATTYWKEFGWWFLVICAIVLILGDTLIRKLCKK